MTAHVSANLLRLSIVLATDTYETLRPVIRSPRRQIDREQFEIVIIAPSENLGQIELVSVGWVRRYAGFGGFLTDVIVACPCAWGTRRIGTDCVCRRDTLLSGTGYVQSASGRDSRTSSVQQSSPRL